MDLTPNTGQEAALRTIVAFLADEHARMARLTGYAGCHRAGQGILMADGSVKVVEDIRPGDLLASPDDVPRTVLSLAQGRGKMVEICPNKGAKWVVNLDHILTVYVGRPYTPRTLDLSVREFLSWPPSKQKSSKLIRSKVDSFASPSRALPIDAYLLGVLLGDGVLEGTPAISKPYPPFEKLAQETARDWGLRCVPTTDDSSVAFRLSGEKGRPNPLTETLRGLGLWGTTCDNKFIPAKYKTASRHVRLEILAGLVDTDGSVDRCGTIDFISKSRSLSDDLCFLARSVGLAAYNKSCQKRCQTGAVGDYWRVCISGDLTVIPLRFRKVNERKQKKNVLRTGFTIKMLGEEDYYGFSLSGDGRFLLDDFTVTHNTGKTTIIKLIAALARSIERPVYILAPTGKAALRVREATGEPAMTIHRLLYSPREDPATGYVSFSMKDMNDLQDLAGALIIVDEASMVSKKIWDDLSLVAAVVDAQILLVGDTFQLEPVQEGSDRDFAPLALPTPYHAHLDEVLRQALDSPVLRAATAIRLAKSPIDVSKALGHLDSLAGQDPLDLMVAHPEMPVLCHRNVTRHKFNTDIRARKGLPPEPVAGEPLLVLRNNYAVERMNGEVIPVVSWLTGTVPFAARDRKTNEAAVLRYRLARIPCLDPGALDAESPAVALCLDEVDGSLRLGEFVAQGGYRAAWREGAIGRGLGLEDRPAYLQANYGYSLTCHKSQGSQWPEVLVVLEPTVGAHTISGRRWTYTAITRAQTRVWWTYL